MTVISVVLNFCLLSTLWKAVFIYHLRQKSRHALFSQQSGVLSNSHALLYKILGTIICLISVCRIVQSRRLLIGSRFNLQHYGKLKHIIRERLNLKFDTQKNIFIIYLYFLHNADVTIFIFKNSALCRCIQLQTCLFYVFQVIQNHVFIVSQSQTATLSICFPASVWDFYRNTSFSDTNNCYPVTDRQN